MRVNRCVFMLARLDFKVGGRQRLRAGFTLVEVMVGVGVLALLSFTIFRIVSVQLMALQGTRKSQLEVTMNEGIVRYLQTALTAIPPKQFSFRGIPHIVGMAPADEIQWVARPGVALLTSAATDDDYALTFTVQPSSSASRKQDLGIRRRLVSEPDNRYEWIPLLEDVAALEFRYFHPNLAAWVDRWEDSNALPALVRMKLWRKAEDQPFEVVMALPNSRIQ